MGKTTATTVSTHVNAGRRGTPMIPVTGKQGDTHSSQAVWLDPETRRTTTRVLSHPNSHMQVCLCTHTRGGGAITDPLLGTDWKELKVRFTALHLHSQQPRGEGTDVSINRGCWKWSAGYPQGGTAFSLKKKEATTGYGADKP